MIIRFKYEGGFAYLPGLNITKIIDTAKLPHTTADRLRRLIRSADFFELPATVGGAQPCGMDCHHYTISIETPTRKHTVKTHEPVNHVRLSALIEAIQTVIQTSDAEEADVTVG